jgi:Flp pilus assembly protein TadD
LVNRQSRIIDSVTSLRTIAAFFALFLAPPVFAQDFSQNLSQGQAKADPSAALIQQANDALGAGDYAAALKLLTTLNAQTPNNAEILYDLGLTTEALDDQAAPDAKAPAKNGGGATESGEAASSSSAESYYRKSIDANPLFPTAHVALGLLLARTGRAAEAHAQLLTATQIPDTDAALKARALRAMARLDLAAIPPNTAPDLTEASTALLAAIQLTAETPEDILLTADIAEATPDTAGAEQAYRRYLALPGKAADPTATAALAHILLSERDPAEAEMLLTAALERSPKDPTLTAQLAAAYLASGDEAKVAKATPLLESLHTANPGEANIGRLLARVYLETGHLDQAEALYGTLISAEAQTGKSPDPTLLAGRAEALMRLHRPGAAETLLKQATANAGGFPTPAAYADALTQLAFAASEIDDPKTTLQSLTLRSTVLPPTPSVLFLEAAANDTLHQSSKAVDLYKQFLAAAHGDLPEEESQARQRLAALEHSRQAPLK